MRHSGFTLIELMIVVSMIAILAGISVPIYHGYVDNAALSEAQAIIAEIAAKGERYYISFINHDGLKPSNRYCMESASNNGFCSTKPDRWPAYTRQVQKAQGSCDQKDKAYDDCSQWQGMGFPVRANNDNRDIFNGPVYFTYWIHQLGICAHRNTSNGKQVVLFNRDEMKMRPDYKGTSCD